MPVDLGAGAAHMVVVIGDRLTAGGQPSLLHSLAAGSDGFEPLPLLAQTPMLGAAINCISAIFFIRVSSKIKLIAAACSPRLYDCTAAHSGCRQTAEVINANFKLDT